MRVFILVLGAFFGSLMAVGSVKAQEGAEVRPSVSDAVRPASDSSGPDELTTTRVRAEMDQVFASVGLERDRARTMEQLEPETPRVDHAGGPVLGSLFLVGATALGAGLGAGIGAPVFEASNDCDSSLSFSICFGAEAGAYAGGSIGMALAFAGVGPLMYGLGLELAGADVDYGLMYLGTYLGSALAAGLIAGAIALDDEVTGGAPALTITGIVLGVGAIFSGPAIAQELYSHGRTSSQSQVAAQTLRPMLSVDETGFQVGLGGEF